MLVAEKVEAILHAGDFDYIDSPQIWDDFVNQYLPADFPYFAILGLVPSFLSANLLSSPSPQ